MKRRACAACSGLMHKSAVQPGWIHETGPEDCPLRRPCDTCRVFAGQWCMRPSEHRAMDLHASRLKAVPA